MIAAIYARKSTEQNGIADEAKSVTRQIEHAREYAVRKGWTVADDSVFVDDGISGAEFDNRPGFQRLLSEAARRPRPIFQVLIVSEVSRLGREMFETGSTVKRLATAGVRIWSYLADREVSTSSSTDKVMLSLASFADEIERERASQRTKDALQRKAQSGYVTGGRVFGYRNHDVTIGVDAHGRPIRSHVERRINEGEAAVVREIFDLAALGVGRSAIAKRLNELARPHPRAQRGRLSGWCQSSVREVLFRDTYRGVIVWNKTRKRDQFGRAKAQGRPPSEWMRIEAPQLRIVSGRAMAGSPRTHRQHARGVSPLERREALGPATERHGREIPWHRLA